MFFYSLQNYDNSMFCLLHSPDRLVEPVVEDDTYVELLYDVVDIDRGGHVVGVLDGVVCVS